MLAPDWLINESWVWSIFLCHVDVNAYVNVCMNTIVLWTPILPRTYVPTTILAQSLGTPVLRQKEQVV